MKVLIVAIYSFAAVTSQTVQATTWAAAEVEDPIIAGEKCSVMQPSSYGGYVYQAASRYDQVFWPLTVKQGIWFCQGSGFTAFIGDFDNLAPAEILRIKDHLANNPLEDLSMPSKLARLEEIYGLRDSDVILKNKLNRVLARWYQDLGQLDKANAYRARALQEIARILTNKSSIELAEPQRLEYLYVAANYSKQLGNKKQSDEYLAELRAALNAVVNDQLFDFRDYLAALLTHTQYIRSGGKLDPILPAPAVSNSKQVIEKN